MSHGPSSSSAPAPFVPRGRRDKNRLAELRAGWGRPVKRERPTETVALYHRRSAVAGATVDDTTWSDLALEDFFGVLDRTGGMPGRQVLYHRLRTYETDPAVLAERTRQHEVFRRDAAARERIQLIAARLDGPGAAYMAPLLLDPLPKAPPSAWLYFLLSVLTPACLIGVIFAHGLLLPALLLLCVNVGIYASYGQKIQPHFTGFAQIVALLASAVDLASLPDPHSLPELARLRDSAPAIKDVRRRLGWLVMDRSTLPDLVQSLFVYLNMVCLLDIVAFLRSLRALREHRATLIATFEAVGSLDAAIAVASYLDGGAVTSVPELVPRRHLDVTGLYHPLIPAAVANALTLSGRSALIAGPNMAGKTAFVRTIGINLVLAQTLHFCHADRAVLPRSVVRSAIRREDALAEGSSYFFTEIRQLLEFVRAPDASPQVFLIDEIFRGTNTVERIAGSAAVLRQLARHHLVFATTHDFELQEILADACEMFHFRDRVIDGQYGFDYLIFPGPVRTRNAIRLLELSGYPPSVVAEALKLAGQLESRSGPAGRITT